MTITTLSSRELNQDVAKAKNAAQDGPVFITDRGRTTHVLLSFEEYQRLTQQRSNIADALAMPGVEDIEFAPPRVEIGIKPVDFDDVRSRYQRRFGAPEGANRQGGQKPAGREFNRRRTHAFVSAITIMELETGVLQIERRDTAQGALLRAWLDGHVLPEFAGRVLPVDTAVAQRCARLHVPDRRSERTHSLPQRRSCMA